MTSLMQCDTYISMVGQDIGVSDWHLVDQKRIDVFADATEDQQFIHIDPARAKATPFGSTIAHGFLTTSLISVFSYEALPKLDQVAMNVNYGFDKLRFVSPVKAGVQVRGHFSLKEATLRKPKELFTRVGVSVEIEGESKPALVADWLALTYFV
ncbi:MaoC family dehydratase [Tardiphaga sp.]|jgi:acyl dehydratase|uniref:MaoC family dehydratase n=1 Tax=Tardiphaga sp. TaxID=1926292 RepID=UPI0026187C02|nr:MaoC family dehydratase [Tardiphaga sp.]MDB5620099.1 MaoC-like dehydratase [Tardiphaga sp.]